MTELSMESAINTINQEKIKKALELLEDARLLERDRMIWGFDCVYRHVEGVNGAWLEKWGEDDEKESVKDSEGSLGNEESKAR